jgi:heat shock protein HslJ
MKFLSIAVFFAAVFFTAGCATSKSVKAQDAAGTAGIDAVAAADTAVMKCCEGMQCKTADGMCSCGEQCAMKAAYKPQPQDFGIVKGKTWKLAQAHTHSSSGSVKSVKYDASKHDKAKTGDTYTLQFDDKNISGKAAPNRYTAPYSLGEGGVISVKPAASTLMAAVDAAIDGLGEKEYLRILEKISRWEHKENKLFIYGTDGNVLIFEEIDYKK